MGKKQPGRSCLLRMFCLVSMLFVYESLDASLACALNSSAKAVVVDSHTQGWIPHVWENYLAQNDTGVLLPDFSRAGYGMGDYVPPEIKGPVFNVTDSIYGAFPDDLKDDTVAIQSAIHAAESRGGGVVLLPKGRYDIRKDATLPGICRDGKHCI